jgi:peptidoglycan/LPS O-acetylase OafA/YrhL
MISSTVNFLPISRYYVYVIVTLSLVLAVIMASISWVLVERPAINISKKISTQIKYWRIHE